MTVTLMFANNASSRLYAAIDAVTTSIRVQAGDGAKFPQPVGDGSDVFAVTVEDRRTGQIEIMTCTGRNGDVLNVTRGLEGTTAQAFAMDATVSNRLTAATMNILANAVGVLEAPLDGKTYGRKNAAWIDAWASPALTGIPTAPTPVTADNSTKVATTAFVTSGFVKKTGDTMTGNLTVAPGGEAAIIVNKSASGVGSHLFGATAGLNRWELNLGNNGAESGGNAGSDFTLTRYDDSGSWIGVPLWIARSNGAVTIGNTLTLNADPTTAMQAATKQYVDALGTSAGTTYVKKTGDTMTGLLTLNADPTAALGAATKQYVDLKANIASPVFTGVPQAPTVALSDSSTSIATTAYIKGQSYINDAPSDGFTYGRKNLAWSPVVGGAVVSDTAPPGPLQNGQLWYESDSGNTYIWYNDPNSSQWVMVASAATAGGDYVKRSGDSMTGPLVLPSDPSANLQAATKQYVDNYGVPAGAVSYFAMNTPPTGWLKANGATVSRTTYAQLFSVLGTLYGSGDGSTTFTLPDFRGEFLRAFDDSRGVDASRAFGSAQAGDVLSHTHAISVTSGNNSVDHSHSISLNSGYQSADHSHGQGGTWGSGGRSAAHSHSQSDNLSGNITGGWGCYGGGGFTNEVMIGRGGGLQTGTESADHSHNTAIGGSTGGVSANHYHGVSGSSAGASVPHTHAISGTSAATGGTETRPRNIAVLACIKY